MRCVTCGRLPTTPCCAQCHRAQAHAEQAHRRASHPLPADYRTRRQAAGLTGHQLSKLTDIPASTIYRYETGQLNPTPHRRARLLEAIR